MNYSLLSLEYRKLFRRNYLQLIEGIPFCSFQKIKKYCHLVKNCQKETGMRVTTIEKSLPCETIYLYFADIQES